jgi:hypothetical protein
MKLRACRRAAARPVKAIDGSGHGSCGTQGFRRSDDGDGEAYARMWMNVDEAPLRTNRLKRLDRIRLAPWRVSPKSKLPVIGPAKIRTRWRCSSG